MKRTFLTLIALLVFLLAKGQNMDDYFQNRGAKLLAGYAHFFGEYKSSSHYVNTNPDYVDVDIVYQDGTETVLRIYHVGSFFSKIDVIRDNSSFEPFFASKLIMNLVVKGTKKYGEDDVKKTLAYMETTFGIDPEKWDGKTWALFSLILDYNSTVYSN